jgi:hypothetical protein
MERAAARRGEDAHRTGWPALVYAPALLAVCPHRDVTLRQVRAMKPPALSKRRNEPAS